MKKPTPMKTMYRYGFKPFFDGFRSWLVKKVRSDPTILKAAEQYSRKEHEMVVAAKSHLGLKVDRIPPDPKGLVDKTSLALGYMIGIGFSFSFTAFSFYQTQLGFDKVNMKLDEFKEERKRADDNRNEIISTEIKRVMRTMLKAAEESLVEE